jgi:hypothetical protein
LALLLLDLHRQVFVRVFKTTMSQFTGIHLVRCRCWLILPPITWVVSKPKYKQKETPPITWVVSKPKYKQKETKIKQLRKLLNNLYTSLVTKLCEYEKLA